MAIWAVSDELSKIVGIRRAAELVDVAVVLIVAADARHGGEIAVGRRAAGFDVETVIERRGSGAGVEHRVAREGPGLDDLIDESGQPLRFGVRGLQRIAIRQRS